MANKELTGYTYYSDDNVSQGHFHGGGGALETPPSRDPGTGVTDIKEKDQKRNHLLYTGKQTARKKQTDPARFTSSTYIQLGLAGDIRGNHPLARIKEADEDKEERVGKMAEALHASGKQRRWEDGFQKWRVAAEAAETLQDGSKPPRLIDTKQRAVVEAAEALQAGCRQHWVGSSSRSSCGSSLSWQQVAPRQRSKVRLGPGTLGGGRRTPHWGQSTLASGEQHHRRWSYSRSGNDGDFTLQ